MSKRGWADGEIISPVIKQKMKNINELINSIELEELSEREEFVTLPTVDPTASQPVEVDSAALEQKNDGITLARWIYEF